VICSLIKEADDLGTDGISVPNTGYFKTGILKQIGFREFGFQKYKTNFYITMYKDQIPSGQNQRFYVEIV
jgi:hypothetical protein